jgi:hypothetical protein
MAHVKLNVADPGIGQDKAPIGSEAWAQRVRLNMQSLVNSVHQTPDSLRRNIELVTKHRAWTLMNKPDGSFFSTWEEFCEHRQPWGLGRPWEQIRPYVEAVSGKRAVQLVTVAPDARAFRERDESGRLLPSGDAHSRTECGNGDGAGGERTEELLRAIVRAPEQVQDAYRAGLIGQKEAAALGPKDPEPEQAAKAVEVARAVDAIVKSAPKPETPKAKRELAKKVNATVREALGKTPDPVRAAAKAVASVPTQRLAELACALPLDVRRMLLMCLKDSL